MKLVLLILTLLVSNIVIANDDKPLLILTKKIADNRFELQLSEKINTLTEQSYLNIGASSISSNRYRKIRSYETNKQQQVWIGEGQKHSSVTLIKSKHGLSGSIRTKEGTWLVRPSKNGQVTLEKFDKRQFQAVTDVLNPHVDSYSSTSVKKTEQKDLVQKGSEQVLASAAAYNSTQFQHIQTGSPAGFSDNNDVRILVYYSSDAIHDYPNLEDLIELDFADANQALINSNIDASYSLAGFIEISDVGTEHNLYDMLNRVGNFERMDEMREKYDADLVHFYGGNVGWVCGVAFYTADSTGWVEPQYAVGATVPGCAGTLTFAHEVGHNLGARHDRYVENGGTDDYAYGYVDVENEFRTLMSYTDKCNDNGKWCTEITHYSNPEVTYNDLSTGMDKEDVEAANNSFLLNKTANLAANYNGVGYPENFQVSKGSVSQAVELTWNRMLNADGYEIKRELLTESCSLFKDVYGIYATTTENSISIENLISEQYCYWVRAYKDYEHGARIYSAPTLVEIGYPSEVAVHISDLVPQHITTQNNVITLPFSTNVSTPVSASILDENASNWLTVNIQNLGNNNYQLILTNTAQISASAVVVVNAGDTKEYLPVQFSGYSNSAPNIEIPQALVVPQGGSADIEFVVSDDAGKNELKVNYYSEDIDFIKNSDISIDGNTLTVTLSHELTGSAGIMITAFDGELQSRKRFTVGVERNIYTPPTIPEEITVYVDGTLPLTRLLPGYSIDADEIAFEVSHQPTQGSLVLEGDSFTYTPIADITEDSFTLTSQLVANGDEEVPDDIHITTVHLKSLAPIQSNYQQFIFGSSDLRLLLTHRGQLWFWGRKYNEEGVLEAFDKPTLLLEGDWVDAAYVGNQSAILLLKADGTMWMVGQGTFYDKDIYEWGTYFWEPKQIGTDRDWVAIHERVDNSYMGIFLRKADNSIWNIGESWPFFGNDTYEVTNIPFQINGLYNWVDATSIAESFLLLNDEGIAWSGGSDRLRSLGRKKTLGIMAPIDISEPVLRVDSGLWQNYAYTESGLYGWGTGVFFDVNSTDYFDPTLITETKWLDFSVATFNFSGISLDGELYTSSALYATHTLGRGENATHELAVVGNENDWVASYSVANATYSLKSNGSLWVAGLSEDWSLYSLGLGEESGSYFYEFTQLTNLPLDILGTEDTDGDGILNFRDEDDDNDCVIDSLDPEPDQAGDCLDTDGDGLPNEVDTDDDNDGVPDEQDAFPLDPTEAYDSDEDGIGNNADTDDDNDGVPDEQDAFPLDPTESLDTDEDGIGNNADTDDDNDGVLDEQDAFPLDPTETIDTDNDGTGNNADIDDDNDNVIDDQDAFPLDPTESVDTDNDGIGNNADTDDDNDSVSDDQDAFPLDANESVDTDGDGIGNNADTDDDNDGVSDASDAYPLDATRSQLPTPPAKNNNESSGGGGSFGFGLLLMLMAIARRRYSSLS